MYLTVGMRSAGLVFAVLALALGGCGTVSGGLATRLPGQLLEPPDASSAGPPALADAGARDTIEAAAVASEDRGEAGRSPAPSGNGLTAEEHQQTFVPTTLEPIPPGPSSYLLARAENPEAAGEAPPEAQKPAATASEPEPDLEEIEEYDPWEPFNEKIFTFNYTFDKYVLKPVAKGYNFIVPDVVQQMIGRGFDNIRVVPKLVNNILQWNWKGFAVELGRFVINSTLGIGGLFDIARQEFGLEKTKVDFGQTLGKWGFEPGPFLILPLMPPLTVRDGIGTGVDGAMDVLGYFLPFFPDRLAMRLGDTVNDRSLNLDLFQGFEETTVDLYSAVRNGYLQRRYSLIHGGP